MLQTLLNRCRQPLFLVTLAALISLSAAVARTADAQTDRTVIREVLSLASDTVATTLRATGRTHFYVAATVACDSGALCDANSRDLVRRTFTEVATASALAPNQRWSTLCDNSDEILLSVPHLSENGGTVTVVAVQATRWSTRVNKSRHTLSVVRSGDKWAVVGYDVQPVNDLDSDDTAQLPCTWSPDATGGNTPVGRSAESLHAVTSLVIRNAESCPGCAIVAQPVVALGTSTDYQRPSEVMRVQKWGTGGFLTVHSGRTEILGYDASGALIAVAGSGNDDLVRFRNVDAVATGPGDTVYVLDNAFRRISVLSPKLGFVREIRLSWPVADIAVLRDGRVVTVREVRNGEAPVSVHSASGDIVRSFGAPVSSDGRPCDDCGSPLLSVAPNGYRIWLGWTGRYRIEEWDLGGRQLSVLLHPDRFAGSQRRTLPADMYDLPGGERTNDMHTPGLKRIHATADGRIWVGLLTVTPAGALQQRVDLLDPVRGSIVHSFAGHSLQGLITDDLRVTQQTDSYGFAEFLIERFRVEGIRQE